MKSACLRRALTRASGKPLLCHALSRNRNAFGSLRYDTLLFPKPALPSQSRPLSLSSIPTVLLPPIVFGGLVITLWTYKCIMMVIFQNKIIYMPSVPPFSRSEKVEDYAAQCRPVVWKEHDIRAVDGTALKLLEGNIPSRSASTPKKQKHVVIVYFQGNASSLPPRLPYLSSVLKSLDPNRHTTHNPDPDPDSAQYTLFALSYRGFWTSRGRPSQSGLELDAFAALDWLCQNTLQAQHTRLILWGQSIGAGVVTTTLANLHHKPPPRLKIRTLILETPFLSLRSMLTTLYPQKFLPYRYLWPFLRSRWDSEVAVRKIASHPPPPTANQKQALKANDMGLKKILILQAGRDEIVPAEQTEALERVCREELGKVGVEVERVVVEGALHTEVMARPGGRARVVECLKGIAAVED